MGLIVFHKIFPNIPHISSKCGKYPRIFHGILSLLENIVMNVNNVMKVFDANLESINQQTIVSSFFEYFTILELYTLLFLHIYKCRWPSIWLVFEMYSRLIPNESRLGSYYLCTTLFMVFSLKCVIVSLTLFWTICYVSLMINNFTISATSW